MKRVIGLIMIMVLLNGCTFGVETSVAESPTEVADASPLPVEETVAPTQPPIATNTPTEEPTAEPQPTSTPVGMLPPATREPAPPAQLTIEGDCSAVNRPIFYRRTDQGHLFENIVDGSGCELIETTTFEFGSVFAATGIYGSIWSEDGIALAKVAFDGTISTLSTAPTGRFDTRFVVSDDEKQLVWVDGDQVDDEDSMLFASKLWVMALPAGEPRLLYSVESDLMGIGLDVIRPIAIHNDDIYFWIGPSGLGGVWGDRGNYSNVWRVSANGGEAVELFACTPNFSTLCIGDFSADFSTFVYVEETDNTLYVMEMGSETPIRAIQEPDRQFIGNPHFTVDGTIAFMAVDLVTSGAILRPENGYIGLLAPPYDGMVQKLAVENFGNIVSWLGPRNLLIVTNENPVRYLIIDQAGTIMDTVEIDRYPTLLP